VRWLQRKQLGLFPEGANRRRSAAHPAQRPTSVITQFAVGVRTKIRQFVLLPVRLEILYGIQLRCIGRQKLQPQPPALLSHEVPHQAAAMTPQTIPHDQ
jgi:hypothetical protein